MTMKPKQIEYRVAQNEGTKTIAHIFPDVLVFSSRLRVSSGANLILSDIGMDHCVLLAVKAIIKIFEQHFTTT